jgi:hypothetical protein
VSDDVALWFSALVTISTVISSGLTVFLLRETVRMREAQTEPKIDVSYAVREEWIAHVDIVVRNIGMGGAYDVQFHAEPITDDDGTRDLIRELATINFIRSGLKYLSPGQQTHSFFTNVSEDHHRKLNCAFRVTVRYRSGQGKSYEDEYCIALSELIGLRRVGEPPLHRMANSLEAMRDDVHLLATGERSATARAKRRV